MSHWIYIHNIDPVLVHLGPLRIGWYGLMYAIAFLTGYWYIIRESRRPDSPVTTEDVPNLFTYVILGVIVGGRLGWVIFYGGLPYFEQPYRILQTWKGGMSFHGGLLGVLTALWLYSRSRKLRLLDVGDFVITWVPVGLFLGRIGNFINGELYGAPTGSSWRMLFADHCGLRGGATNIVPSLPTWGVIFPADPLHVPRHPSQLYEAALEGIVIFAVLLLLRHRVHRRGHQAAVFLLLYGIMRFLVEFVRLPDAGAGCPVWILTKGQLLSLPMIVIGAAWTAWLFLRPPDMDVGA